MTPAEQQIRAALAAALHTEAMNLPLEVLFGVLAEAKRLRAENEARRLERVVLTELTLKTGELIEHLQKTGRLKPCFYMPALADARNVLAN